MAIIRARSVARQSRRERGYIEALQFIFDSDSGPKARATRYSGAMEKLAAVYPHDHVAAVLFALSLLSPELPDDPDHVRDRQAVTILNAILEVEPNNPGVTHFIIHACDNPAMAGYGLEAARLYAKIAPASAHALHMPGHIFARLGLWQDDIQSNLASKAAAENVSGMHTGAQHRLHAMEFLQYAYLQIGREDKARVIADEAQTIQASELYPGFESYYGWVQESLKVRLALETRDWSGAMELMPSAESDVFVQRLHYWARAVAAGHLKNRAAVELALAGYEGTFSEAQLLEASKNSSAQLAETRAWTRFAQGDTDAAVSLLAPIADHQDKVGKAEVELPAREMMGDILRLANRPDAAIREYRISLETDVGRFNTLLHAGEVAQGLGLRDEATRYYRLLLGNASDPAPESEQALKLARAFLEAR
jgi:tetratricopeptide (TPR) repeat protein